MDKYCVVCEPFSLEALAGVYAYKCWDGFECWIHITHGTEHSKNTASRKRKNCSTAARQNQGGSAISNDTTHIIVNESTEKEKSHDPHTMPYEILQNKLATNVLFKSEESKSKNKYLVVIDDIYAFLAVTSANLFTNVSNCKFILFAPYGYITHNDLILIDERFTRAAAPKTSKALKLNEYMKSLPTYILAYLGALFMVINFKRVFRLFGKHRAQRTLRGRGGTCVVTQKQQQRRCVTRHGRKHRNQTHTRRSSGGNMLSNPLAYASSALFLAWFTNTLSLSTIVEKLLNFLFDLPYAVWDGVHQFSAHFASKHPRKNKAVQSVMKVVRKWNVALGRAANQMARARFYKTSTLRSVSTNVFHKLEDVFHLFYGESGQEAFAIFTIAVLSWILCRVYQLVCVTKDKDEKTQVDFLLKKCMCNTNTHTPRVNDTNICKELANIKSIPCSYNKDNTSMREISRLFEQLKDGNTTLFLQNIRRINKNNRKPKSSNITQPELTVKFNEETKEIVYELNNNNNVEECEQKRLSHMLSNYKQKIKEVHFTFPPTYEEYLEVRNLLVTNDKPFMELLGVVKINWSNPKPSLPKFKEYIAKEEHTPRSMFSKQPSPDEIFIKYRNKTHIVDKSTISTYKNVDENPKSVLPENKEVGLRDQLLKALLPSEPTKTKEQLFVQYSLEAKKLKTELFNEHLSKNQ